jgi:hypothetical protein
MNHNPSDNSVNVPPSGRAVVAGGAAAKEHHRSVQLNPALQKALNCLDIKLEDELNRFRATQSNSSNSSNSSYHAQTLPTQDLAAGNLQASTVTWEQPSSNFDAEPEILTAEIIRAGLPRNIEENDPAAPRVRQQHSENMSRLQSEAAPIGGFVIIDGLMTTSSSSNPSAIAKIDYAPIALHRGSSSASPEGLDLDFSTGGEITPFHAEYSSSSQELLRQIQSGDPAADTVNNSAESAAATSPPSKLFTPLKIGSMAVACAIAGGVVYTCLNPSMLAPLTATKTTSPIATTNSLGQLIQSPNLAANEFTELTLSRLSTTSVQQFQP